MPLGVVGGFATIRDNVLDKDWQERLQLFDFIPRWHWAIWVSIFLGALLVVVFQGTYVIYARHSSLRRVKFGLRDLADKASTNVATKDWSEATLIEWRTNAERFVQRHLGDAQAHTLKRNIDGQLAFPSPNEVPIEGHALVRAAGWLEARSWEITEADIVQ
jgi:hypothetical protein